jgi:hypothetical protein
VSKFVPCLLIDELEQLELHHCVPRHSGDTSDIHTSFQRSSQMTEHGISLPEEGQRSLLLCEMLADVSFDTHGIVHREFVL